MYMLYGLRIYKQICKQTRNIEAFHGAKLDIVLLDELKLTITGMETGKDLTSSKKIVLPPIYIFVGTKINLKRLFDKRTWLASLT